MMMLDVIPLPLLLQNLKDLYLHSIMQELDDVCYTVAYGCI